jgi:hypothetical protein
VAGWWIEQVGPGQSKPWYDEFAAAFFGDSDAEYKRMLGQARFEVDQLRLSRTR